MRDPDVTARAPAAFCRLGSPDAPGPLPQERQRPVRGARLRSRDCTWRTPLSTARFQHALSPNANAAARASARHRPGSGSVEVTCSFFEQIDNCAVHARGRFFSSARVKHPAVF